MNLTVHAVVSRTRPTGAGVGCTGLPQNASHTEWPLLLYRLYCGPATDLREQNIRKHPTSSIYRGWDGQWLLRTTFTRQTSKPLATNLDMTSTNSQLPILIVCTGRQCLIGMPAYESPFRLGEVPVALLLPWLSRRIMYPCVLSTRPLNSTRCLVVLVNTYVRNTSQHDFLTDNYTRYCLWL